MKKLIILLAALLSISCREHDDPVSNSGAKKASVKIQTDNKGLTTEQNNIIGRLKADNEPGSIKHLYVISTMSGDVILYSTVKGKVTSSGKRLTPTTVSDSGSCSGIPVQIGNDLKHTNEVLQDDGSYGSSIEYLFWWDSRDIYHQHYPSGGQIIHVSNQPMNFPKIILNLEEQTVEDPGPVVEEKSK